MSDQNKQSYVQWFDDQISDFLRGCEARNDLNIVNYYDTVNQWYAFYKQKCFNDSLVLEKLLQVKQESDSKIKKVFEDNVYREIRESWSHLHLQEVNPVDSGGQYLRRLLQHVREKLTEFSSAHGGFSENADHLIVARAAGLRFILENLNEESEFFNSIEVLVIRKREAERSSEQKSNEAQRLTQIVSSLQRDIAELNAQLEQSLKRTQQMVDELSKLKFRNIELENLNANLQKQASVLDQEKSDAANTNSVLKHQLAEQTAANEDLSIQIKRTKNQLQSEKDSYLGVIRENQEMISSIKKFHREEIAHLKKSNEQERLEMEFKIKELEALKEEQVRQIEMIAKTYVDKKNAETEIKLAESAAESKAVKQAEVTGRPADDQIPRDENAELHYNK